jgi:hypothetical protein
MEKRVRLRIDRGAGITMVVEKGDLPEVRHYPLRPGDGTDASNGSMTT